MVSALMPAFAESASADFSILLPEFVKVESVLSPVLIANITDRTGNLYAPLCSKFKVITNSSETKKLYLKALLLQYQDTCKERNSLFGFGLYVVDLISYYHCILIYNYIYPLF